MNFPSGWTSSADGSRTSPVLAFTRTSPGQRLLVAFNLSADAVQWALPDGLEPHAINDKGLLAGRVDRGQLHLPARGVFFARLD